MALQATCMKKGLICDTIPTSNQREFEYYLLIEFFLESSYIDFSKALLHTL